MSLLARLLSPSYRRGLSAEAAGELEAAARAYAQAGRPRDVLRVRRLLAAATADSPARVAHLRAALALATTLDGPVDRALVAGLERDLARALLGAGGDDPSALEEAAERFGAAGDHLAAADALLALGRVSDARRALAEGRHFERLEEVDRAEAEREASSHRIDAALAEAQEALAAGRREAALGHLRAIEGEARDRAEALAGRLEESRGTGRIGLALGGGSQPVTCVGELPILLGRGEASPLPLRDPGISRHHARIARDDAGVWTLEDLESRNGTFVEGIPIAAPFPFSAAEGRFALGDRCRIAWTRIDDGGLLLTVDRGLSTGSRALAVAGPVDLGPLSSGAADGVRLDRAGGWFVLSADVPIDLAGRTLSPPATVELVVGDEVAVGEWRIEVRSH